MTIDLHKLRRDLLKDCKHPQLLDEALLNLKPFFERLQTGKCRLPYRGEVETDEMGKLMSWCLGHRVSAIHLVPYDEELHHLPRQIRKAVSETYRKAIADSMEKTMIIIMNQRLPIAPTGMEGIGEEAMEHKVSALDEPLIPMSEQILRTNILNVTDDEEIRKVCCSSLSRETNLYLFFAWYGCRDYVRHFREYASRLGTIFPIARDEEGLYLLVA